MKIRIEFTVDVDPKAWIENYGVADDEVRDDVKGYCQDHITAQLDRVSVLNKDPHPQS